MGRFLAVILMVVGLAVFTAPTGYGATVEELQQKIQELLVQVQNLQSQLKALQGEPLALTHNLSLGQTDDATNGEVSELQRFLARDKTIYSEGLVTGYFGSLTETAVKRWQAKFGVVSSGSPNITGYGVVGPRTLAKINELLKTGGVMPAVPATPAIPAAPKGQTGTTTIPAKPAQPATPAIITSPSPSPTPTTSPTSTSPTSTTSTKPIITIQSPTGGEVWAKGGTYTISWSASNVSSIRISLYKAGGYLEVITLQGTVNGTIPNTGSYNWTIPLYLADGSDYSLRVFSLEFPNDWKDSAYFTIAPAPSAPTAPTSTSTSTTSNKPVISIQSPTGGENWIKGNIYTVRWTASGVNLIRVSLYKSGAYKKSIAFDIPNSGSYSWSVPTDLTNGSDYQVRVFDIQFPNDWTDSSLFTVSSSTSASMAEINSHLASILTALVSLFQQLQLVLR